VAHPFIDRVGVVGFSVSPSVTTLKVSLTPPIETVPFTAVE
jgi:hypothetical protein